MQWMCSFVSQFVVYLKGFVLDHFLWKGDVIEIAFLHVSPFGEIRKRFKAISMGSEPYTFTGVYEGIVGIQFRMRFMLRQYARARIVSFLPGGNEKPLFFLFLDGAYHPITLSVKRYGWGRVSKRNENAHKQVVEKRRRVA